MKRIFSLSILFLVVGVLYALPVKEAKAKLVATEFLNYYTSATRTTDIDVELLWTDKDTNTRLDNSDDICLYVFGQKGKGAFVIIAGEDAAYPVLGYSMNEVFMSEDAIELPTNIKVWLDGYKRQIQWLRENGITATSEVQEAWENLQMPAITRGQTPEVLIETARWDQTAPYNLKCPTINKKKAPAGCVATAMGILMYHHKYPEVGKGTFEYITSTHKIRLSASFDEPIDWNNLIDIYKRGSYNSAQSAAVSQLLYNCGIMAEMDYDQNSSGTQTTKGIKGLIDYMYYDKGIVNCSRDWYWDSEWIQMMKKELNENRPIIYDGHTANQEGHAFILDGYAGDYFHVNWGWNGSSNGYFLLSALDPSSHGTGGGSGGFNYGQSAFLGVQPLKADSKYNDILGFFIGTSGGVTYNGLQSTTTKFEANKTFEVHAAFVGNFSMRTYNGVVALGLIDRNDKLKQFVSQEIPIQGLSINYGNGFNIINCKITKTIEDGDVLKLMHKSNDSDEWKFVQYDSEIVGSLAVGKVISGIEAPNVQDESVKVYTSENQVTVRALSALYNVSIYDMNGKLLKTISTADNSSEVSIDIESFPLGIYILKASTNQGTKSSKFFKN